MTSMLFICLVLSIVKSSNILQGLMALCQDHYYKEFYFKMFLYPASHCSSLPENLYYTLIVLNITGCLIKDSSSHIEQFISYAACHKGFSNLGRPLKRFFYPRIKIINKCKASLFIFKMFSLRYINPYFFHQLYP